MDNQNFLQFFKKKSVESCWQLRIKQKLKKEYLLKGAGGDILVKPVIDIINSKMTIETFSLPGMVKTGAQIVDLEVMKNSAGYNKYYAKCPDCRGRYSMLYLRTDGHYFSCRHCSHLFYQSTRNYIAKGPLGAIKYILYCEQKLASFLYAKRLVPTYDGKETKRALRLCKLENRLYSKTPYRP
jgi:hypothetical protein